WSILSTVDWFQRLRSWGFDPQTRNTARSVTYGPLVQSWVDPWKFSGLFWEGLQVAIHGPPPTVCNTPNSKQTKDADFEKLQVRPRPRTGGPWFTTATPPQTSSDKSAKSRLTDRPTVRRSDHGRWSLSVDRDLLYPASDTNYGRPARAVFDSRSVGLTVDEDQRPVS
ncbi:hypothetical protein MTR67_025788, partial [Solanum verrucosum]